MPTESEEDNNTNQQIVDLLSDILAEVRVSNHHLHRLSIASNTHEEQLIQHNLQLQEITREIQNQTILQQTRPESASVEAVQSAVIATPSNPRIPPEEIASAVDTTIVPQLNHKVVITHRYKNQLGTVGKIYKTSGQYVHLRTKLGETFKKHIDNVGVLKNQSRCLSG